MPSCPKSKVRKQLAGHTGEGPAGHFLTGMKAGAGFPNSAGSRGARHRQGSVGCREKALEGLREESTAERGWSGAAPGPRGRARQAQPAGLRGGASREASLPLQSPAGGWAWEGPWAKALVPSAEPHTTHRGAQGRNFLNPSLWNPKGGWFCQVERLPL